MNKLYAIVFLFFCIGCANSKTLLEDLIIKNGIFYKDSSNIYSGHVFTKFDDGKVSNDFLIKDGVPSGKWISYGYEGEVVQQGKYQPVILNSINIEDLKEIQRINICETQEGNQNFTDIFIVSANLHTSVDKTDDRKFKDALIKVLKDLNIGIEPSKVNKIIAAEIELK